MIIAAFRHHVDIRPSVSRFFGTGRPARRARFFYNMLILLAIITSGCAARQPPGYGGWASVPADEARNQALLFDSADAGTISPSISHSLGYLDTLPTPQSTGQPGPLPPTPAVLSQSLRELQDILPRLAAEPHLLADRFVWFRVDVLLTGYYEPLLPASLEPGPGYPFPIYALPPDLRTLDLGRFNPKWRGEKLTYRLVDDEVRPYPDRRAIDQGLALAGRGLEIAWAKDAVDVYGLQVQGSGLLALPDGSTRQALYAGQNGRPYVSLGKVMADRGLIALKDVTWPRLRHILADNPVMTPELLAQNPSYVFFSLGAANPAGGPLGSMGRPLTPLHSVAVDRSIIPLGSLLALEGDIPTPDGATRPFATLALAQDTGGAIKGARADLFCGRGPEAEFLAGNLKHHFIMYMLLSRKALGGAAP